jgi:hypothetical protein
MAVVHFISKCKYEIYQKNVSYKTVAEILHTHINYRKTTSVYSDEDKNISQS